MEINIKTFGPSTNLEMLLKGLSESQKFLVNDGLDYKKIIDEDRFNKNSVFLSVLIRTQGKRRETLKETLLSLYMLRRTRILKLFCWRTKLRRNA